MATSSVSHYERVYLETANSRPSALTSADQTYHNYSEDHDEHQNGTAIMGPAPTGGSSRSNPRKEPTFMHYVPPVDVGQTATSGSGQGSRSSMPLHPAARQSDENNPPIGSSMVTVFSQFECEPYETAPREYRGKHSASKHGGSLVSSSLGLCPS